VARLLPACVPSAWLDAIDEVAKAGLGRDDRTGAALAAEVKRLSDVYTKRDALRDGPRSKGALAARLRFFLPRDLAKARAPIDELVRAGALEKRETWRVLDVGAGLGATSLGALAALHDAGLATRVELVALDDDAQALALLEALVRAAASRGLVPETTVVTRRADVSKGLPTSAGALPALASALPALAGALPALAGPYDLVLAGFVLNELFLSATPEDALQKRVALVRSLAAQLAPHGALVVLEPALKGTSRALHALRDVLAASDVAPFVAAPCLRVGPCPMLTTERDWCHEDLPLSLPLPLIDVARTAGLRFEGLSYAYLTLRNERGALHGAGARGVALRVVSDMLVSKGKRELFGCGVPGRVRLVRLDRARSDANAVLEDAGRGDVLDVEPLALDERMQSRVGEETVVTRVAELAARTLSA